MNDNIRISVIVPVYKVAAFVERCATSLFEQTLGDGIEFIFVDDCTPDNSISIIEECLKRYPHRAGCTTILHHEYNKGLPAARNTGMSVATGKYIFHCDSDDWMERDGLQSLLEEAERKDADIVWGDWYLSFARNERYMTHPSYTSSDEALQGVLAGAMKFNVWNKLVKRQLYIDNDITFPAGYGMGEDMTMIKLFAVGRTVSYLPKAVYHYNRTNSQAYTADKDDRFAEIEHNVNDTIDFVIRHKGAGIADYIDYFLLNIKLPMLISTDKRSYERWQSVYPEANRAIMRNHHLPLRTRLLQLMADKGQFWAVKAYNLIILKLIYGGIYR